MIQKTSIFTECIVSSHYGAADLVWNYRLRGDAVKHQGHLHRQGQAFRDGQRGVWQFSAEGTNQRSRQCPA
jgi:hypothetical protein